MRKNTINTIINSIKVKRKNIKKSYDFLRYLRDKNEPGKTPLEFFEENIINDLVIKILNEDISIPGFSKQLFEKFKDDWLEIKKEKIIELKIFSIQKHVKKMKKYLKCKNNLEEIMVYLVNKYYISFYDIEEHRLMLDKQDYEANIIYTTEGKQFNFPEQKGH